MPDLLPCPFCGGVASVVHVDEDSWNVECVDYGGCATGGPWRNTESGAVSAWNRRVGKATRFGKQHVRTKTLIYEGCG